MYDSGPPQVWLIVVWVFIGIMVFLIASLMFFWKTIQRLMFRWTSKRRSVVVPLNHPRPSDSIMRAFRANSLFQPAISNRSRLSTPIKPPSNIDLESGELIPAQWPIHPAQYKMNIWRYDPMMRKVSINENEEAEYVLSKVHAPNIFPKRVRVKRKRKNMHDSITPMPPVDI